MRIAIYARVSTRDKQEAENQLLQLREFAARMNWETVHEYVDKVSGAKSENRPQFKKMFAAASRREFDLVLFWALDRFSREGTLATLNYLQQLDSYGVGYRSYAEQYIDSTGIFKDVVVALLATLAKQERIRLSERVTAGLERARRQGRTLGRPKAADDYKLVHRVEQARTQGKSIRTIATELGIAPGTVVKLLKEIAA